MSKLPPETKLIILFDLLILFILFPAFFDKGTQVRITKNLFILFILAEALNIKYDKKHKVHKLNKINIDSDLSSFPKRTWKCMNKMTKINKINKIYIYSFYFIDSIFKASARINKIDRINMYCI